MAKRKSQLIPKRGEVYYVNFDPTIGSEIKQTRPAVILQNNVGNRFSPVTIVAALSSQYSEPFYPTEILIIPPEGGLEKPSVVLLNQLRTIDKQRLVRRIGLLKSETMERVDRALEISLGLVDI